MFALECVPGCNVDATILSLFCRCRDLYFEIRFQELSLPASSLRQLDSSEESGASAAEQRGRRAEGSAPGEPDRTGWTAFTPRRRTRESRASVRQRPQTR